MSGSIIVIVPVYKVEKYIERCIKSILIQTYENFELVLVDDGSPDRCGEICEEYAKKDGRIKVIHQENAGLSAARNVGIEWVMKNSESKWITFVDSDDWLHPKYLELLFNAVNEKNTSIAVCNYLEVKDEVEIKSELAKNRIMTPEELYCKRNVNAITAWGKLYSRELFVDMCFPNYRCYEDEFLIYKILFKVDKLIYIEQPLYMYYKNENSIMHSLWSLEKLVIIKAIEEQLKYFKDLRFEKAYMKAIRKYKRVLFAVIEKLEKYYPESNCIKEYKQKLNDIQSNKKLKIKMFFNNIHLGIDKM